MRWFALPPAVDIPGGRGKHLHPQFRNLAVGIGQQRVDIGKRRGRAAAVLRLVERVQDDADQQRLGRLLPVRLQSPPVRIDDQGGQVLHVAYLMLAPQADLFQRIPVRPAA